MLIFVIIEILLLNTLFLKTLKLKFSLFSFVRVWCMSMCICECAHAWSGGQRASGVLFDAVVSHWAWSVDVSTGLTGAHGTCGCLHCTWNPASGPHSCCFTRSFSSVSHLLSPVLAPGYYFHEKYQLCFFLTQEKFPKLSISGSVYHFPKD